MGSERVFELRLCEWGCSVGDRLLNGVAVGQQKTVVRIDATVDNRLFEDALGMSSVLSNDDGELFERIDDDKAITVLGEELLETIERSGRDLEAVLLIVVVPPETVEDLFAVEIMFEQVGFVDNEDVDPLATGATERRHCVEAHYRTILIVCQSLSFDACFSYTLFGSTLLVSQSTSRRACSSASLPGLRKSWRRS